MASQSLHTQAGYFHPQDRFQKLRLINKDLQKRF